eukprot:m.503375 g.503375  ORF g.503375 m.503375 type:complete len:151 (-) comp21847_c0_seq2:1920-2372(-)
MAVSLQGVLSEGGVRWNFTGDVIKRFTKHGHGVQQYSDGAKYEGWFKNGEIHGTGTMVWGQTNTKYSGEWAHGLMHGHGVFTFENGGHYEGSFSENKMHGSGKMTVKIYADDGTCSEIVQEGQWVEGVFTPPPADENVAAKPKSGKKKKK